MLSHTHLPTGPHATHTPPPHTHGCPLPETYSHAALRPREGCPHMWSAAPPFSQTATRATPVTWRSHLSPRLETSPEHSPSPRAQALLVQRHHPRAQTDTLVLSSRQASSGLLHPMLRPAVSHTSRELPPVPGQEVPPHSPTLLPPPSSAACHQPGSRSMRPFGFASFPSRGQAH